MADILRIKRRALGGAGAGAPANLAVGELAFNENDGGLYIGRSDASVVQVNPNVNQIDLNFRRNLLFYP